MEVLVEGGGGCKWVVGNYKCGEVLSSLTNILSFANLHISSAYDPEAKPEHKVAILETAPSENISVYHDGITHLTKALKMCIPVETCG